MVVAGAVDPGYRRAAKSGLREGDVIQEVNKQPVKNAKDLVAISKELKPNEKILMRVYSQAAAVTSRWKRSDVTPNVGVVATALWAVFIDSTTSDMTDHRPVATAF